MVKKRLLLVLVSAMLLAGCSGQADVGDQPTQSEGPGIQIEGPECTSFAVSDKGCTDLLKKEPVKVTLTVENTGGRSVVVPFGKKPKTSGERSKIFEAISGNILKKGCPDLFDMKESTLNIKRIDKRGVSHLYRKPRGALRNSIEEDFFTSEEKVELEKKEELRFEWVFRRTDKVPPSPDSPLKCNLDFSLDTLQEVNTQKKIRLRRSRDAQEGNVEAPTSSASPLVLNIDGPSNWLQSEGGFPVHVFIENREEGEPVGPIQLSALDVRPSEILRCSFRDGGDPSVIEYKRNAQQQTRKRYTCTPTGNLRVESNVVTLTASSTFRYRYDIEDIQIEVGTVES